MTNGGREMLQDEIMKLQTYKMFEGDDTVYVERDDVLKALKQQPCEDAISRQAVFELIDFYDGQNQQHFTVDNLRDDVENVPSVIPKGVTVTDFADKCRECGREKVLDKIRAEIESKCCITVGRENDPAITLYDVFEIIDKYKAESEGADGD